MRHYKLISDGYILSIGTGNGGTGITETESNEILSIIHNKPPATETVDYRLREDLTWEPYQREPEPEPEPDAAEILDILTGGAT